MDTPDQEAPLSYLQRRRRKVEARIRAVRENQPARSSAETYAQMDRMKASEAGEPASATPEVQQPATVDWTQSAAFQRDRTGERVLSAEESAALIKEAGGRY